MLAVAALFLVEDHFEVGEGLCLELFFGCGKVDPALDGLSIKV